MNLSVIYKISGYLSLVFGAAAALCIYRPGLNAYGILLALPGFILGLVNIFLNIKYFWQEEKYPKGYLGIFLSSTPILFMMFMIFKAKH